ncbi:TetR/AcrR family transcriptional regulator [Roseobacter sinensis]|uniref:HTH tetR-type domain-containing protein n=1 Tax=Roseobacter sinensis TaxID=2931391 RepID=A0ABT3BFB2_9RHOB|nr:hypothetical protein [Roseobacter sp. WL0113]MCV3272252.1 hypothetical protein [Roseobacter sp. WL0113]
MSKSADRRAALLDLLADHVLAQGMAGSSLRALAAAGQVSDRMLLYYFEDKPEIMAAVLQRLSQRLVAILEANAVAEPQPADALRAQLTEVALGADVWPYMRLWLEIAAAAAQGDAELRQVGEGLGRGFLAWVASQLDGPEGPDKDRAAAQVFVWIEGTVLLKSIGLEEVSRGGL